MWHAQCFTTVASWLKSDHVSAHSALVPTPRPLWLTLMLFLPQESLDPCFLGKGLYPWPFFFAYIPCMCLVSKGARTVSDSLELESQMFVSCHVGAES